MSPRGDNLDSANLEVHPNQGNPVTPFAPRVGRQGGPLRVACLGECMIELRTRPDGALTRGFGGDTLNTAIYLARLGVKTDYVTALSDDVFSAEMLKAWSAEGLGVEFVLRPPGRLPGLYMIEVDSSGERRFHYWRDQAPARDLLSQPGWPDLAARLIAAADVLYLSGITLSLFRGAAMPRLFDFLRDFAESGGRIVFDANFRARGWPDRAEAARLFEETVALSSLTLAGVEDLAPVWGEPDPEKLAGRLEGLTPEAVLKVAPPGSLVIFEGKRARAEAPQVTDVLDTTAAGDSFAAGYLAARLGGASPEAAARAGHRLAAEVVRHPGAIIPREAMPPE